MPIGPWPDFDACVAANQDKADPAAYCAAIERRQKEAAILSEFTFSDGTRLTVPASTVAPNATVDGMSDETAASFAVVGDTDLPVAARDREWDGSAARTRVFDWATDADGDVDVARVSRAFVIRRDDANPQTQAAYSLGFADVIDGELQIIPRGVAATAGGRGLDAVEGISASERERAASRICALYAAVRDEYPDWPDCPFDSDGMAASAGEPTELAVETVDPAVNADDLAGSAAPTPEATGGEVAAVDEGIPTGDAEPSTEPTSEAPVEAYESDSPHGENVVDLPVEPEPAPRVFKLPGQD